MFVKYWRLLEILLLLFCLYHAGQKYNKYAPLRDIKDHFDENMERVIIKDESDSRYWEGREIIKQETIQEYREYFEGENDDEHQQEYQIEEDEED